MAAKHLVTTPVPDLDLVANCFVGWHRFCGWLSDLHNLVDEHLAWLSELPVLATTGGTLLMHARTDRYLELGSTIEEINTSAREILHGRDLADWTHLCDILSSRGAFLHDGRCTGPSVPSGHPGSCMVAAVCANTSASRHAARARPTVTPAVMRSLSTVGLPTTVACSSSRPAGTRIL